ncbi:hypothetical protein B2J88_50900 [Rhodococcus sp. SRB_17]|nr:hypothetical protein [Rhodococcus sp. SRB_17]
MTEHNETNDAVERKPLHPRAERTRGKLLAAAAARFDTEGYALANINTVVADAETTKGGMYFHFASKEAMAQTLIEEWSRTAQQVFADAEATGSTAMQQLVTIFRTLARHLEANQNLRAGMKLSLEPSIEGSHQTYWRWVDNTSELVERAIKSGDVPETPTVHRLAWNLWAGTIGATHATSGLREDVSLSTRIDDATAAHFSSIATNRT